VDLKGHTLNPAKVSRVKGKKMNSHNLSYGTDRRHWHTWTEGIKKGGTKRMKGDVGRMCTREIQG